MADEKVALVVGAGNATGGAVAKRFAADGFSVCVTRRNRDKLDTLVSEIEADGGSVYPFGSDARHEDQVEALINEIETNIGPIEVAVYNVGGNVRFSILETTSRVYFKVWEMACFGGFLLGREVAKRMVTRKQGTIIFTGATASLRGGNGFAAFSGGKHALRALAQSMARELGPEGIHVAHVVIDGAIDTEWIAEMFPERYKLKDKDGILNPDHIADMYWQLYNQHRSAWTFELDMRPWIEKF